MCGVWGVGARGFRCRASAALDLGSRPVSQKDVE